MALRKRVVSQTQEPQRADAGRPYIEIVDRAELLLSSEDHGGFPIENAFDGTHGAGSSQWIAASPGPQTIQLCFDTPQTVTGITYEVEEREVTRTQEVLLQVSGDSGRHFQELVRQEFNFSPQGATFQRENLNFDLAGITDIRLTIKPDKGDTTHHAKLNFFGVRA